MLAKKCIVVGVTGGIAAYKAAELVSALVKQGANVHVIMTKSAQEFVTPLTFQTLSRNPVVTDMFALPEHWEVKHISLADKADLVLVVPATANIIGKVASGIADDMLSTVIMATTAPVIFAPAMNVHMYENPILQKNISYLSNEGYTFVEPGQGNLACGYQGVGRLADVSDILRKVTDKIKPETALLDKRILITAGPTREAIDPVRYISNHSSGKMGYAIAGVARDRGAKVTLISGPCNLPVPTGVEFVSVETAEKMLEAVKKYFKQSDIIIKSAAVADYRPKVVANRKIKKTAGEMVIELEKTTDILKTIGTKKGNKILIGFAAETNDLIKNAKEKIAAKNLDFIVANNITEPGAGFGVDTNIVSIIYPDGKTEKLPLMDKVQVAKAILDRVEKKIGQ